MSENNYLESCSLIALLRKEEENLRRLLDFFYRQEIIERFPNETQRLNSVSSPIESDSGWKMRRAMKARYEFMKSVLLLYFNNDPEKIGLSTVILQKVCEILGHN